MINALDGLGLVVAVDRVHLEIICQLQEHHAGLLFRWRQFYTW
jgi:hypothetical protein